MLRKTCFLLQFSTCCILIGFSYGEPLKGIRVRHSDKGEYPFIVSVSKIDHNYPDLWFNNHMCTGVLISKNHVLTAAHCLIQKNVSDIQIIAGSTNLKEGKKYYAEWWVTYIEWKYGIKDRYSQHDLAVIKLQGDGVQNVIAVDVISMETERLLNMSIRIAGWGKTDSGLKPTVLRKATMTVISNNECSEHGTSLKGKLFSVPDHYFCTTSNPKTLSTPGDAGAPILRNKRTMIGINIGACPYLEGLHTDNYLNDNLMNSNLNLYYYMDFVRQFSRPIPI